MNSIIFRLLSGHCRLNADLYKIRANESGEGKPPVRIRDDNNDNLFIYLYSNTVVELRLMGHFGAIIAKISSQTNEVGNLHDPFIRL